MAKVVALACTRRGSVFLLMAVLLLDYTLYLWHFLTHKSPMLWRYHQVHHVDLDLDASTALRFHAGEMLLSVPWRVAQVLLLGVSPLAADLWARAARARVDPSAPPAPDTAALVEQLADELVSADAYVFAVPLYN